MLRTRQRTTLERELAAARARATRFLIERQEARAEGAALRDEVLSLQADGIANDPSLWQAIAQRNADEAEAYARQLRAHKIDPDRDYGRTDVEVTPGW